MQKRIGLNPFDFRAWFYLTAVSGSQPAVERLNPFDFRAWFYRYYWSQTAKNWTSQSL